MVLRPDEAANQSEIQRDASFRRSIGSAASIGVAAGSGVASRVLPFLNEYIPTDLAIKGISKISPKLGDFIKGGIKYGLDAQEGLNYIKEQISPKEPAKESRNIIEQYSPELFSFIKEKVNSGMSPIQAGEIAQRENRFGSAIKSIEKDHKTNWLRVLDLLFGSGQAGQSQQQMQQQPPSAQGGLDPQLAQIMQGIRGSMQKLGGGQM